MLLWACPISLLGLVYLLLLASLLLAPPLRGRYAERDGRGRYLEPPSSSVAGILNHRRYQLSACSSTQAQGSQT